LDKFQKGFEIMQSHQIGYHAGHGLTDESLRPLVEQGIFAEYNIGHWIICDALFNGLSTSIKKLIKIIENK
jgi:pyridoxine 5-phosphate synthase